MGPYYGKLTSRDRDKREAPPTRLLSPHPGAGLPCQQASPAVYAQSPANTPQSAASATPGSLTSDSPRSSTPNPSRSAASSKNTLSSRRDDFLPPSHSISDRSLTSTPLQRQVNQSSTSAQGSGSRRHNHVHGCKCHVCQPDLYDGADPRLFKRSAVRGAFMKPCVEACRCPRCCEERGDTTVF